MMRRQGLLRQTWVFPLLLAASACISSQAVVQNLPKEKPLDSRVPEFELNNETLLDGLSKLARGSVPFGFGFERMLKNRLSDPEISDTPLTLRLQNKSMREILDALCEADPRYTWSVDEGTVDVFPRAIVGDDSYLLNRRLRRFELKNATDVQNGLLAIARQLPPPVEQIAEAQLGGADPYPPEPWSITLEDVTVRQVINKLAAHGGPYGTWIFGGAKDFRAFGFFNTHPSPWLSQPSRQSPQAKLGTAGGRRDVF
jgi:hypothetical protein